MADFCCKISLTTGASQLIKSKRDLWEPDVAFAAEKSSLYWSGCIYNQEELDQWAGNEFPVQNRFPALILKLLQEKNTSVLAKIIGDYCGVWWDPPERRLVLFTDHCRRRELYYRILEETVIISTRLNWLLAVPGVKRPVLDPEFLAATMILARSDPGATCWQGIRIVPPATALILTPDRPAQNIRYWQLERERTVVLPNDTAYADAARDLLDRAVACRLNGPGPAMAQLTGGLDSSAVTSSAALQLRDAPLHTFTRGHGFSLPYDQGWAEYGDEETPARAIAARYPNIIPHIISDQEDGTPPGPRFDTIRIFQDVGEPIPAASHIEWFAPLYDKVVNCGGKYLLNGNIGNTFFSHDGNSYLNDLFWSGKWLQMLQLSRKIAHWEKIPPWWEPLRKTVIWPLLPVSLRNRFRRWRTGRSDRWGLHFLLREQVADEYSLAEKLLASRWYPGGQKSVTRQEMQINQFEFQTNFALPSTRRLIWGIEDRAPLSDIRLMEFCTDIPSRQFILNGIPRSLARRVLAPRLPAEVVGNPRHGGQDLHFFRRMAKRRDEWQDQIERFERSPLIAHLIDLPRLRRIMDHWPDAAPARAMRSHERRNGLPRAIQMAQFILWTEGANQ